MDERNLRWREVNVKFNDTVEQFKNILYRSRAGDDVHGEEYGLAIEAWGDAAHGFDSLRARWSALEETITSSSTAQTLHVAVGPIHGALITVAEHLQEGLSRHPSFILDQTTNWN